MSYNNVVGGKLKLKGKALDVKSGGLKKKKKKKKKKKREKQQQQLLLLAGQDGSLSPTQSFEDEPGSEGRDDGEGEEGRGETQLAVLEDHRTPAEKRYAEQKGKLDVRRLAKLASKSHRDRVEEFNQYLANLSEHYDIPKVGPG